MVMSSKSITPLLVGVAMLASTMPAHGQSRMMHMRPSITPRQVRPNPTTMRRTPPSFPHTRSRFDPFEDRFERRFGFDPFLNRRFGFDPFFRTQFGFDPFLGIGGFGSFGSGVTPFFSGSPSGFGSFGLGVAPFFSGGPSILADSGAGASNSSVSPLVEEAQASVLAEQARAERIANRRRVFDEYLYERDKTPTAEQERLKRQREQLSRSLNNPPVTEIWSGRALNDILADLRTLVAIDDPASLHDFPLPLDLEGLKHINVTGSAGNIALVKSGGWLTWPEALSGTEFQGERERLTLRARAAVRQARFNSRVDAGTLVQMTTDVDSLEKRLRSNAKVVSPSLYIEAKIFLRHFTDAITALRQEDVSAHFTGTYALQAKTVPELVKEVTERGLQFAAALPGDEAAYTVLHQALVAYDRAVQSRATTNYLLPSRG